MEFSTACPTSRRPPRGQLQRFVTSPPHDGGDLPSGLPPRANSLPLFPAVAIGTLPTLQNRFPEPQFLCLYRHRTYLIPSLHHLFASTSLCSPLPALYLKTAPYKPHSPAIMESTTALPNLFMPRPRDHSPHKEFSDWGAGAFSIKLISGRSVLPLKLFDP